MCNLSGKTAIELDAMSKADIITSIFEDVTRITTELTEDENGEDLLLEETTTDAYETLLGSKTTEWTYYLTGEVDEVTVTERDSERETIDSYVIKHYLDGRQPILS